jgi:amino acid adenylation domain-containing protein/non-ribosomal peptide synthase protein (TIGR01720 family)
MNQAVFEIEPPGVAEDLVEGFRMSPQQRRLWALGQGGQRGPYQARCRVLIEGALDPVLLREALHRTVRRHEILHTTFQHLPGMAFPLQVVDNGASPVIEQEGHLGNSDDSPADASWSTLRATISPVSSGLHRLVLSLPGLCADARGLCNLIREVSLAYQECLGREETRGEPTQYADFAEWQNELLEADETQAGREYWRRTGDRSRLDLKLPFECCHSDAGFAPEVLRQVLGTETATGLRMLAAVWDVPVPVVVLTAWRILLHRLAGGADFAIGVASDGRKYQELEEALGLFGRYLPIEAGLDPSRCFTDLLQDTAADFHEACKWQESLDWEEMSGAEGGSAVFCAACFEFEDRTLRCPAGGVSFTLSEMYTCFDRFKVKLACVHSAEGLTTELHYDAGLFVAADVQRLLNGIQALLAAVVSRPEAPVAELDVLGEDERRELLVDFNSTGSRAPLTAGVHRVFEEQARRAPERDAVVCDGLGLTYAELNARANQVAHHLRALGVEPEVPVALCVERSIEMMVGVLGILKAGGCYVPLDPALPRERQAFMLEDTRAPVILTQEAFVGQFPDDGVRRLCLDRDWDTIAGESRENPAGGAGPENLVYIIYTSGSTGRPKGVAVEHRQLVNYVHGIVDRLALEEGGAFATVSALAADLGNTSVFPALWTGGTLHVLPHDQSFDTKAMADYFARHRIDFLKIVPSHLAALLGSSPAEGLVPHGRLVLGGETFRWDLVQRVRERSPDCRLWNHYGPTETTVGVLTHEVGPRPGAVPGLSSVPMGRPLANSQVYLLDARLLPVPAWAAGELFIGGAGVTRGYLHRPELTAERFVPDLFSGEPGARMYGTGDLARRIPELGIEFLGRADHQVKIRGFRIELGEIEMVLAAHPEVREAVALAREGEPGEMHLVAYVAPREEDGVSAHELRSWLRERMPEPMVPSTFVLLAELPRLANGKLDRKTLPAPERMWEAEAGQAVAPRTFFEDMLADLWVEVLGVERVGVRDNFFELGGHSLLATQVVSRVREAFQVELPVRALFDAPTVAELVNVVERLRRGGADQELPSLRPVARDQDLPLSFAQQRLWFLDQLEPGSSTYNIAGGIRLIGRLDADVLERSLGECTRRHEALRTSFPAVDGRPCQVISQPRPAVLPGVDLRALSVEVRGQELEAIAMDVTRRPFSLAGGSLLRAVLVRVEEEEYLLLFAMHHIISDGWSMGILMKELTILSEALIAGRPSPLSPLPVQYADFAIWQRRYLQGEVLDRLLASWRERLAGSPDSLLLPTDRPRPVVLSSRGARREATFSKDLSLGLRHLGRRQGVTLFMTILASFTALLSRYSGQTDIVVGAPVANRNRSEIEPLIGFFVNTLVLRTAFPADISFHDLLGRVREVVLDAYALQDLPFEKLVDELQPQRNLSRTPLFQVMFALQNTPRQELRLPGVGVEPWEREGGEPAAKFDLTLILTPTAGGLSSRVEYSTDLFDSATICRLLGHLESLLRGAAEDLDQRLPDLPLLTEVELQQLLVDWSEMRGYASGPCLHRSFEEQAERAPDVVAVVFEEARLTYGELNRRANRLAHHLAARGVGLESLVGVCLDRSAELVTALLGVLKAGGAYVPLDPTYPRERLDFLLRDAGARVVVTRQGLLEVLSSDLSLYVCLDRDRDAIAGESAANPGAAAHPESLAYVIYTSGSTGKPKGALITHGNVARLFGATAPGFDFNAGDVWTLFHSFAFDFSVWELWGALLHGGRLVIVPYEVSRTPEAFYELLGRERVTVLNQTPSAFRQLIQAEALASPLPTVGDLALRWGIFGGEALELRSLEPWFRRHGDRKPRWVNMYGITETTVHVTFRPLAATDLTGAPASVIGQAIPDLALFLLGPSRELMPIGVPGELYVAGAGLARGYLGRPDLTAERFVPHPFSATAGERLYRTGDVARRLPGGELVYLGRMDRQVKIRGFRVELGEIETALAELSAVGQAVVLDHEDGAGGRRLTAYVVLRGAELPTAGDLRSLLQERLPDYMVPALFVLLETLPLTGHGKIDRKALLAIGPDRPDVGDFLLPRTEAEKVLGGIWSEVLRIERVGIHDNFFEMGGDSILSIQIIARANRAGLRLAPKHLFLHQTIAELAAISEDARGSGAEQGLVTGSLPLTPIQRWFFAQELPEAHHFNQSVFLSLGEVLHPPLLEQVVAGLCAYHDALRLRFRREPAGWRQVNAGIVGGTPFTHLDLSLLPRSAVDGEIAVIVARLQASLDLAAGPLVRVAQLDLGAGRQGRLLLVIHHLAVDGVSWRILLEDLQTAYGQRARGEAMALPDKTTSYRSWARRLGELSRSGDLVSELEYWRNAARSRALPLPVDAVGENRVASARSVGVALTAAETESLLLEVPKAYRTQINDVLLTALALAFEGWTGSRRPLLVDLEGHGREEIFTDVDLSRTVGWFTSIFPVLLDLEGTAGVEQALKSVKERLRQIPRRGIGYGLLRHLGSREVQEALDTMPRAEVSFNYLGQLDRVLPESSPFGLAPESSGPARSPRQRRGYLLEVNARIAGGRMQAVFRYGGDIHQEATVERLAGLFHARLRELIAHCSSGAGGYTPSDFPLAKLDQQRLDGLVTGAGDVEDLYPLSPLQQGFLFHSIYDEPGSGVYFRQVTCVLQGPLHVEALRQAWQHVVDRHSILRSSFFWGGLEEPLQRVSRHAELPFFRHDWRHLSALEQRKRLEIFLAEDRGNGFDGSRAPLMRIHLIRLADETYRFVWGHHHLLLDGWSTPVLVKEVFDLYDRFSRGEGDGLERPRPYSEYIAWLVGQDLADAEAFWRRTLEGFKAATPLGTGRVASMEAAEAGYDQQHSVAPEAVTTALRSFTRRSQLTLNTLVQGAWALLLGELGGVADVVFGCAVSGRPAFLPGVESMVGVFLNTQPVRVLLTPEQPLMSWLQQLQAQQAEAREYEYCPLVQVQKWSDVPQGMPLFESFMTFQNYPVNTEGPRGGAVVMRDYQCIERVNFPLSLVAVPGPPLKLELKYDCTRFDRPTIVRMLEDVLFLLRHIPLFPESTLSALRESLSEREKRRQSAKQEEFRQLRRQLLKKSKVKESL